MTFSYYPGCTLKTKAKELDGYARRSAEALGITLDELADWQCCGGVYTTAKDEIATKLSSVRALMSAKKEGNALVTLCSACHNVIKQTKHELDTNDDMNLRASNYMGCNAREAADTEVIHYLEMLRDVVGFDKIKEKVVNPLTGRKIAAYYGCLLLRPGKTMQFDNPENPKIIEDFIRAIGATPVIYPMRNECCGGYITVKDAEAAKKNSTAVHESAAGFGADCIITACPLCRYNLIKAESPIPVIYFTELLAEALGVK
ncbi:MAG: CoB--CoM heterodisulfide reductase iron-sulfur subunit B family protein [Clostridia bacterium]|nr:CoB--CoM heterodisulfide reductase iron-sulfur subunit B family protein [Clostridia bacterium]